MRNLLATAVQMLVDKALPELRREHLEEHRRVEEEFEQLCQASEQRWDKTHSRLVPPSRVAEPMNGETT